jgi:hypothetical protein
MSRSGYTDDCDDNWSWICWRGAVKSAIRGKRGQAFLRETLAALDALPERKLITHDLIKLPKPVERWDQHGIWFWDIETELESVCTLGAVGLARNIDMSAIDPENNVAVAALFNIPHTLACEIMFMNDEAWWRSTPEERFAKMREWVASEIRE